MRLPLYQVDAFTDRLFGGNPAAVVPLEAWLDDAVLQDIAAENNLSETAYLVDEGDSYALRWFTPAREVPLCGHATLASAHVVVNRLRPGAPTVRFTTRESGTLTVARTDSGYEMDFPAITVDPVAVSDEIVQALGTRPDALFDSHQMVAVFPTESDVRAIAPDMRAMAALPRQAVIVTAPGDTVDFVSRMFAPAAGIPEDPVTGSAHCRLTPYWVDRLGRNPLRARQISRRGGDLTCTLAGDRVRIAGQAVLYLEGTIEV